MSDFLHSLAGWAILAAIAGTVSGCSEPEVWETEEFQLGREQGMNEVCAEADDEGVSDKLSLCL